MAAQSFKPGETIEQEFVVREKSLRELRSGQGNYLTLTLVSQDGQTIDAKVWENADALASECNCGDVVLVKGQVGEYKGQAQLKVLSLAKCSAAESSKFVPALDEATIMELGGELKALIATVSDRHLRALLDALLGSPGNWNTFCHATAARSLHSAYVGGLLEHTVNVAKLCQAVCEIFPVINRDLLLTAAIIHDIGKLDAIALQGAAFEYTEEGKLVGEPVLGERRVRAAMQQINGFPARHRTLISHLLLSHHGQYDFGAPILPSCLEALVLHLVDNLEAKANAVSQIMQKETDSEKMWSDFNKSLGRSIYLLRLESDTE